MAGGEGGVAEMRTKMEGCVCVRGGVWIGQDGGD